MSDAVVLATGMRSLARRWVLVKRPVCIDDAGRLAIPGYRVDPAATTTA